MDTQEGNALIAGFMGHAPMNWNASHQRRDYDNNWNYLMNAVAKIEQDEKFATMMYVNTWDNRGRYIFSIYREMDENRNMRNRFVEQASDTKIKSVWLGVIRFIELLNENNIPRSAEDFNKQYTLYKL